MGKGRYLFSGVLMLLVIAYASGYLFYRNAGFAYRLQPRDGGPMVLNVKRDSTLSQSLAKIFAPCRLLEEYYLGLQYRPV